MINRRSVVAELPHHRLTARHRVKEHGAAEHTNDVPTIMPTVSTWDQHFALLSAPPEGGLELRLEQDRQGVQEFYEDRVRTWLLLASHGLKKVQAPWYSLHESVADIRLMPSGEVVRNRVAVLFPTWTDGIIGEIGWEPQWAEPASDWRQEADVARRLDDLDAAWLAGDVDARLAQIQDDGKSVIRIAELGGNHRQRTVARTKAELAAAWSSAEAGRVIEMEQTNRVVSYFYAFAAYRMVVELPDRTVEREVACLYPVGSGGRFVGEFSYGFEVQLSARER
jgi:hypothetical protein